MKLDLPPIDFSGDVWAQIRVRAEARANASVAARIAREPKRRGLHRTHVAHFNVPYQQIYHRLRPDNGGWYQTVCGKCPGDNGGRLVPAEFRQGRACEMCYPAAGGRG